MACSALRPPNTTATRTLPAFPLIAATLVEPGRAPADRGVWQPRRCPADRPGLPPRLRLAGAAVHLYTASGTVLGLLIVLAAIEGETVTALWLVPGRAGHRRHRRDAGPPVPGQGDDPLVRRRPAGRHRRLPDLRLRAGGAAVDDRLTCPTAPLGWVLAALPLLASSYQFCRVDAKTDDHFFLGFPSYWNVVAFYAIVLDRQPTARGTLVVFSVLVFVPVRYLYPSRRRSLRDDDPGADRRLGGHLRVLLLQYPDPHPAVVALSLAYLVYYVGLSV